MADNKQIVVNAFETLFNKRDYAAAERFWSPNYIQHSAHIPIEIIAEHRQRGANHERH